MNILELPPGRVLRREIVNGKHQKHVIVKAVRVLICDICQKQCRDKVVQTQKTGNVRIASCCMECANEEYK